jgi:hypothetical protein
MLPAPVQAPVRLLLLLTLAQCTSMESATEAREVVVVVLSAAQMLAIEEPPCEMAERGHVVPAADALPLHPSPVPPPTRIPNLCSPAVEPLPPVEVEPVLREPRDVQARLTQHLPQATTGEVPRPLLMWAQIDSSGAVRTLKQVRSSGVESWDSAATVVLTEASFRPALGDNRRVPAWIGLLVEPPEP